MDDAFSSHVVFSHRQLRSFHFCPDQHSTPSLHRPDTSLSSWYLFMTISLTTLPRKQETSLCSSLDQFWSVLALFSFPSFMSSWLSFSFDGLSLCCWSLTVFLVVRWAVDEPVCIVLFHINSVYYTGNQVWSNHSLSRGFSCLSSTVFLPDI